MITTRTKFLFGAAIGAWLNIWTQAWPWGPFIFAYVLVFICIASLVKDRGFK